MRANISWGEEFPAFFLTAEDSDYFDDDGSAVDLPDDLVTSYQAAVRAQRDMIQAIREHCERTGQHFPEEPA